MGEMVTGLLVCAAAAGLTMLAGSAVPSWCILRLADALGAVQAKRRRTGGAAQVTRALYGR